MIPRSLLLQMRTLHCRSKEYLTLPSASLPVGTKLEPGKPTNWWGWIHMQHVLPRSVRTNNLQVKENKDTLCKNILCGVYTYVMMCTAYPLSIFWEKKPMMKWQFPVFESAHQTADIWQTGLCGHIRWKDTTHFTISLFSRIAL